MYFRNMFPIILVLLFMSPADSYAAGKCLLAEKVWFLKCVLEFQIIKIRNWLFFTTLTILRTYKSDQALLCDS